MSWEQYQHALRRIKQLQNQGYPLNETQQWELENLLLQVQMHENTWKETP